MLKASRYNLFVYFPPNNVQIGFNSVSGAVLIFSPIQYEAAKKILQAPNQTLNKPQSELKDMLLENRFLVEGNVDEIRILKVRNNLARHSSLTLGLIIAPTLLCNFDCPYCYVDRNKIKMGAGTIEKIKKFVLKKINCVNKLVVCWTGGEPLLALDVIEELNNFFISEARKRQKKFSSSLVTNGYLLDQEHAGRLKKIGIESLQITLDGDEEYHNNYRYTEGGGKTYRRILRNAAVASKGNMKIMLRTNLNQDNWEGVYKLIDDLSSQDWAGSMLRFTPCRVVGAANAKGSCHLFSANDFSKLEPKVIEYALERGIDTNIIDVGTIQAYCGANRANTFVIDPYADILKCWCHLGDIKNNKIGHIKVDGNLSVDFPAFAEWMGWDPFEIDECKKCSVLPLCMGGCKYFNDPVISGCTDNGCSHRKYNLEEMLKLHYLSLTRYKPKGNDVK